MFWSSVSANTILKRNCKINNYNNNANNICIHRLRRRRQWRPRQNKKTCDFTNFLFCFPHTVSSTIFIFVFVLFCAHIELGLANCKRQMLTGLWQSHWNKEKKNETERKNKKKLLSVSRMSVKCLNMSRCLQHIAI